VIGAYLVVKALASLNVLKLVQQLVILLLAYVDSVDSLSDPRLADTFE
jgi:hypothetical protein